MPWATRIHTQMCLWLVIQMKDNQTTVKVGRPYSSLRNEQDSWNWNLRTWRNNAHMRRRKRKQCARKLQLAQLQASSPASAATPTPEHKAFSHYHPNDCVITYLDTFRKACTGYNILVAEYTRNLRAYAQGTLLEVLAVLQDSESQDFTKFEQLVCAQFALTPESARLCFHEAIKDHKDTFAQLHCHMLVCGLVD